MNCKTKIIITDDVLQAIAHHEPEVAWRKQETIRVIGRKAQEEIIRLLQSLGYVVDCVEADALSRALQKRIALTGARSVAIDRWNFPWASGSLPLTNVLDLRSTPLSRWSVHQEIGFVRRTLACLGRSEVVCVDLGAQGGQAMRRAVHFLRKHGCTVTGVFLGVASAKAIGTLQQCDLNVHTEYSGKYLRWLELRDMVGLTGKLVLTKDGLRSIPSWHATLGTLVAETKCESACVDLCTETQRLFKELGLTLPFIQRGSQDGTRTP